MAYPNFSGKHKLNALFGASDYFDYLKKLGQKVDNYPSNIIVCFQKSFFKYICEGHKGKLVSDNIYALDDFDIGFMGGFGIGAPAVSAEMEDAISRGANNFIAIGICGTITSKVEIGDLILCDRALRDEGTSYHYLEDQKYVNASSELVKKIKNLLQKKNIKFHQGSTWTTDAPYRETVEEIKAYQNEGILTVEMEASAMFAIGEFYNKNVASLFIVSDSLANLKWEPQFKKVTPILKTTFNQLFPDIFKENI